MCCDERVMADDNADSFRIGLNETQVGKSGVRVCHVSIDCMPTDVAAMTVLCIVLRHSLESLRRFGLKTPWWTSSVCEKRHGCCSLAASSRLRGPFQLVSCHTRHAHPLSTPPGRGCTLLQYVLVTDPRHRSCRSPAPARQWRCA